MRNIADKEKPHIVLCNIQMGILLFKTRSVYVRFISLAGKKKKNRYMIQKGNGKEMHDLSIKSRLEYDYLYSEFKK